MTINKFVTALVLAAAAGSALADNAFPADPPFVSTKSRAAVVAELTQAQASGQYRLNIEADVPQAVASVKSRQQVQAETVAAVRNNELPSIFN